MTDESSRRAGGARRFDASIKHLFETYPRAWLAYIGLPASGVVNVVDADLSAVTSEADKVLRLDTPAPWIVHAEFQASQGNYQQAYQHIGQAYHTIKREPFGE